MSLKFWKTNQLFLNVKTKTKGFFKNEEFDDIGVNPIKYYNINVSTTISYITRYESLIWGRVFKLVDEKSSIVILFHEWFFFIY